MVWGGCAKAHLHYCQFLELLLCFKRMIKTFHSNNSRNQFTSFIKVPVKFVIFKDIKESYCHNLKPCKQNVVMLCQKTNVIISNVLNSVVAFNHIRFRWHINMKLHACKTPLPPTTMCGGVKAVVQELWKRAFNTEEMFKDLKCGYSSTKFSFLFFVCVLLHSNQSWIWTLFKTCGVD